MSCPTALEVSVQTQTPWARVEGSAGLGSYLQALGEIPFPLQPLEAFLG